MQLGILGLGRMGASLAARARQAGHEVFGWDPDGSARANAAEETDLQPAETIGDLVEALTPPRILLMYVPHGPPVDANR